jgi:RNA polymerase sigma factor (sigma-70 family)
MTRTKGPSPREEASQRQTREQIETAMTTLPDRQQTAVVLFEIEGCSIKEIAAAMECSEGAVKFNIHEARKKLQRQLGHLVQGLGRRLHLMPATDGRPTARVESSR